ncbi:MAG: PEGA domain-containing protein [Alphaproteobacteria bacterium]|nr:PEGA domain-containing protein [Alphaproteobacteria bacterium]
MTPGASRLILWLCLTLSTGCVRRVTVRSDPPGASVTRRGESIGVTPLEIRVWFVPFAAQQVRVGMPGYRGVYVALGRKLGLFRAETVHEVMLVPNHGRSGTWTPEEAADASK